MKWNRPDRRLTEAGPQGAVAEGKGLLCQNSGRRNVSDNDDDDASRRQHCGWKAMAGNHNNNNNNTYGNSFQCHWTSKYFKSMSLSLSSSLLSLLLLLVMAMKNEMICQISRHKEAACISRPYLSIWVALNEDDVELLQLQPKWKPRQAFQFTVRLSRTNPHSAATIIHVCISHELLWHDAICLILNERSQSSSFSFSFVPINIHINITVCMQFAVWHCWKRVSSTSGKSLSGKARK